jgi:lipopolysaccharide export system protein LptC
MQGGAYSRFVALAKVVLPLAALALLATLFLFARRIDPDAAIPFAEVDVERFAREARIGAPEFSGVTADGTVISISATAARPLPDAPGQVAAEGLAARFQVPDGSGIEATAAAAIVDAPGQRLVLSGGVDLGTSTGYRVVTEGLTASLGETALVSDGAVTAEGPPGRLEAGGMTLRRIAEGAGSTYLLVFNQGVRLVYRPQE